MICNNNNIASLQDPILRLKRSGSLHGEEAIVINMQYDSLILIKYYIHVIKVHSLL